MTGWLTAGMGLVGPLIQNGAQVIAPNGTYPTLSGRAQVPIDTETVGGAIPQTMAATVSHMAFYAMHMVANQATSTAGAATLNTFVGMITTEALTTAPGATYTFTLTNSLIQPTVNAATVTTVQTGSNTPQVVNTAAANPPVLVQIYSKSNTVPGMTIQSVLNGTGNATFVFVNNGNAALNGTMLIGFSI